MSKRVAAPKYRLHKPSGRAVVTINGRDIYLGQHGSPESRAEYRRIVAEFLATGAASDGRATADLTIAEQLDRFRTWADGYYRLPTGEPTSEIVWLRDSCKRLRLLYGHTKAADFGPVALEAIRQEMVRAGLSRSGINGRINRIRRVFKWGVSKGLVPSHVFESTRSLPSLRRGRSDAKESEPVRPVDDATIDATLPHLGRVVRAMVQFQRATGARPGETCRMKVGEIDTTQPTWTMRPEHHKTAYRGRERVVFIGKRAQAVLEPFLRGREAHEYVFSPRQSAAEFRAQRTAMRKTPVNQGNGIGSNRKRKPKRAPGDHYTVVSYGRAVRLAADKADRAAKQAVIASGGDIAEGERLVCQWSPNQLRHAFATKVRRHFGLEAAQVLLGHATADVTQVYAERDVALAEKIARQFG